MMGDDMAMTTSDNQIPTIFNEIIRKRVADYIDGEVTTLIKAKTEAIITEVLSGLQVDAELFKDMYRHETGLVVKAVYKGQEIKQHSSRESVK